VLACAQLTSFYAAKRLRSRPSTESDSSLKLTQQRGIRATNVIPPRSTPTISVKHIPTKMLTENHKLFSTTKALPLGHRGGC
jgi:hypothetical protein